MSKHIVYKWTINNHSPVNYSDHKIKLMNERQVWECHECESLFIQKNVSEDISKRLYKSNRVNRWNVCNFNEDKTPDILDVIKPLIKTNTNVLDVGCNTGEFLDYAHSFTANTYGVEYSKMGRKISKKKKHTVFVSMENIPNNIKFDIIFAFDLVEHLYKLKTFFNICRKRLSKNGKLIILTGNPQSVSARISGRYWWYFQYPEHNIILSRKLFNKFSGFRLDRYAAVYNSKYFRKRNLWSIDKYFYKKILEMISKIVKFKYDGLPSLDKDHALVILSKI